VPLIVQNEVAGVRRDPVSLPVTLADPRCFGVTSRAEAQAALMA